MGCNGSVSVDEENRGEKSVLHVTFDTSSLSSCLVCLGWIPFMQWMWCLGARSGGVLKSSFYRHSREIEIKRDHKYCSCCLCGVPRIESFSGKTNGAFVDMIVHQSDKHVSIEYRVLHEPNFENTNALDSAIVEDTPGCTCCSQRPNFIASFGSDATKSHMLARRINEFLGVQLPQGQNLPGMAGMINANLMMMSMAGENPSSGVMNSGYTQSVPMMVPPNQIGSLPIMNPPNTSINPSSAWDQSGQPSPLNAHSNPVSDTPENLDEMWKRVTKSG